MKNDSKSIHVLKIITFPIIIYLLIFVIILFMANKPVNDTHDIRKIYSENYVDLTETTIPSSKYEFQAIFFHADWCSTCVGDNSDFYYNVNKIPKNIQVVKVNYDLEKAMKDKYNINYQGTIVLIDNQSNEIDRWIGGGVDNLILKVNNINNRE